MREYKYRELKHDYYTCNNCNTEFFIDEAGVNITQNINYNYNKNPTPGIKNKSQFIFLGLVIFVVVFIAIGL